MGNDLIGWIIYEPERWYCIEQYVKMNTLSGPYDALGNGIGNADGILRGWIDGVMVFEKKDIIFRKHPAIRVDEVWLSHYHGGVIPAEAEHDFEMANLVVASAYIGPMRGVSGGQGPVTGTPLWLQSKPVNQWIAVPGTELTASTCAAQAAAGLTDSLCRDIGYGDPRRGILAYSGGALKKSGSEMLIFGGGGGKAWAGNDIRGLRLEDDAPAWRTLVTPRRYPSYLPRQRQLGRTCSTASRPAHGTASGSRSSSMRQARSWRSVASPPGAAAPGSSTSSIRGARLGRLGCAGRASAGAHSRGWDGNWACRHR